MSALTAFMRSGQESGPMPDGVQALVARLNDTHGQAVTGVVLYGSCRRQADATEGLADLLVLVTSYRAAFGSGLRALLNWLLPPNVFYLEADHQGHKVRCKYAVISLPQLRRRVCSRMDHYFWARFCQPVRLVQGDDATSAALAACRADAARSFIRRIAPTLRSPQTAQELWAHAMATTYRCELRPESPDSAHLLIGHDPGYWTRLSKLLAEEQAILQAQPDGRLVNRASLATRMGAVCGWQFRRVGGKLFNLARLFKAAGTFTNGIDYIVWKVERHSGVRIEPTERMRRHPRLAAWGLAWRMWRQGGFR